ncbi:LysR family transcriptional regulator (plasmid) [Streptomyces sp. HUAS 31]|uniref:LysR family transcriptional regulator n=1 Tax=Streptomyces TaxID=1883 RepID=UPI002306C193|nr:LysR family transcriptional regulator [Streptomyces sp. HUAS 31]WCE02460.1 LysR family transcriptional regulator [Streptomyces sp. HUAS 31]
MDIRDLRYAVTLAEELHFGRAARRHYISAQPFGRRIQRLERDVGALLFERTSRRVALTAAGERFIAQARSVLATIEALPDLHHPQDEQGPTLTLGVLGFGLAELWPRFVDLLRDRLPAGVFVYQDLDFVDQYDAVLEEHVDAAIVHYTGPVEGLTFERVLISPRVAVVPARSELAGAEYLSCADLDDQRWVPVARSRAGKSAWAGPWGADPSDTPCVRTPAALPAAVAATGGLSMHAAAAARFYPHPDVHFVPMAGSPCEIALATRTSDRRPATQAVRESARLLPRLPGTLTDLSRPDS